MTTSRLQVVVAHPDDETFGCGSLLLHARAAGAVTAVCCATRGEAGEVATHSTDASVPELRESELRRAAEVLGVQQVELLGFRDSGMSGPAGPGTLMGAAQQDVVAAVRDSISRFRPDVVVTLDASDSHRDHVRIRDATLKASAAEGVARVYLACLPRSLMRRWVAHVQVERPDMEHLDADVASLGTPDEEITTLLDTASHLAHREQAIAVHASQVSPFEGLPDHLRRSFLGAVHLRRVVPAWIGGAQETHLFGSGRPARSRAR